MLPEQEWIRDAEAVEEVQIMEELPHNLRREIAYSINLKVFRKLAVFHDFPGREQAQIASMMTPVQARALASDLPWCIFWHVFQGAGADCVPNVRAGAHA